MRTLLDQFCPHVHDAALTAAAYDADSATLATADALGVVAVQRPGEAVPGLVLEVGDARVRALGLVRGGALLAVGDDAGSVRVIQTSDGGMLFEETRAGDRGRARAFRGVALSPAGDRLAGISDDGLLRVWDLSRGTRVDQWSDFGGQTVAFDPRGTRILAIDRRGQPVLADLVARQRVPLDAPPFEVDRAQFTRGGTHLVASGPSGLALLRIADGAVVASFAARVGSGLLNVAVSPDGRQVAAVSQRSIHVFTLPELQPAGSARHQTEEPTGAVWWGGQGVRLGGGDGLAHGEGAGTVHPVTAAGGFGDWRVLVHGPDVAVWHLNRRLSRVSVGEPVREVHVDRDGRHLLTLAASGAVAVHDVRNGQKLLDAGRGLPGGVAVGGRVVLVRRATGGAQWWDLARGQTATLDWPVAVGLSHGGTWIAAVGPDGRVRVLDPATGRPAVPDPVPAGDGAVRLLSFVNRRPDLLVLDEEHILSHYDLTASVRDNVPAQPRDVLQFASAPDRIWGITGGRLAAVRLPEGPGASVLVVDLHTSQVKYEIEGLHPDTWVDAETGNLLEPGRGAALLEREIDGAEKRVLRALPDDQWLAFNRKSVLDASEGAGAGLTRR